MSIRALGRKTIGVIADLQMRGCQIIDARVLPHPAVTINPPPDGVIHTYAYRALPRGTWAAPVECVSLVDGVRVVWQQGGVRHRLWPPPMTGLSRAGCPGPAA
jgi:hypothetical protein